MSSRNALWIVIGIVVAIGLYFFLKHQAEEGRKITTELFWKALKFGKPEDVEALLKAKADPNHNFGCTTPLGAVMWVAASDTLREVDLLLKYGADPNLPTCIGATDQAVPPLVAICRKGSMGSGGVAAKIADLLIRKGAKINAPDSLGNTPLHYAASDKWDVSIMRVLLKEKPALEARNQDGETPLLFAAKEGYCNNVETLLEAGANKAATDQKGQNTRTLLKSRKNLPCTPDWSHL